MANSIVTTVARQKLVKARAGVIALPPIMGMAFGDGGVTEDGVVLIPGEELKNELFRKTIDGFKVITSTCYRYTCTLEKSELEGVSISEIGLYDSEGDLIAIKNFRRKEKDGDMEMQFDIDDQF